MGHPRPLPYLSKARAVCGDPHLYRDLVQSIAMRLFVASGIFHPDSGGPATYLYRILPELAARGMTIRALSYGDAPTSGYPYPLTRISFRQSAPSRWLKFARRYRADAAWADLIYLNTLGLPRSGDRGKARVVRIGGNFAWERCLARGWIPPDEDADVFEATRYSPLVTFYKVMQARAVRDAHRVIVPSEYLRRLVIRWGAQPARVQIIYSALTPNAYAPQETQAEARAKLGLAADRQYLLSVGRLIRLKGVHYLLEALDAVPQVTLLVAGDGPMRAALQAQAAARGLTDRVEFVGKIAHEQIPLYMRAADYVALYSGVEGLSHTLLEALTAGTPVIASDRGGNPEVVTDGINGLLVPHPNLEALRAALIRAFSGNLRAELASRTQHGMQQFSWERLVNHTAATLEEVYRSCTS